LAGGGSVGLGVGDRNFQCAAALMHLLEATTPFVGPRAVGWHDRPPMVGRNCIRAGSDSLRAWLGQRLRTRVELKVLHGISTRKRTALMHAEHSIGDLRGAFRMCQPFRCGFPITALPLRGSGWITTSRAACWPGPSRSDGPGPTRPTPW
jgi:hypothetical protein